MGSMVTALVRHALTFAGGALGLSGDGLSQFVGAAATLVGIAWSLLEKRRRRGGGMTGRALLLIVCIGAWVALWTGHATAAPPSPVQAGKTYVVTVDCLPIGCYSEILRVNSVRDGWWTVTDPRDRRTWMVNSARVYAVLLLSEVDLQRYLQPPDSVQPRIRLDP